MFIKNKFFIFVFLSLQFIGINLSSADNVNVSSEVSENKVVLGSAIQFTITVTGSQNIDSFPPPQVDGLEIQYLGPSTRVSIVNGEYSSTKAFSFSVLPLKVGKFTIPSVALTVDGQEYKTQALEIEVIGSEDSSETSAQGNNLTQDNSQVTSLKDKIFLTIKIDKTKSYLNEPIPVKFILYVSGLSVKDIQYPQLDAVGTSMDEFDKPIQYQNVLNGIRYDIIEFDTKIYPTRVGQITVGPAKMECSILVKTSNSRGQSDSLFGDDFFDNFFVNYDKRPISLKSQEVVIDVSDLPQEGKPEGFSQGVGEFNFDATAAPLQVKVGDPITLKMNISGEGNLKAVKFPTINESDQFKVYEPQIKEENGTKYLEQVIIPKSEKVTQTPAINFSYFDSNLKQYKTITKGPFNIVVSKGEASEDFKVVGGSYDKDIHKQVEEFGKDIIFIKEDIGKLNIVGKNFYNTLWYKLTLSLFILLWLSGYFIYRKNLKLETDVAYAKKTKAPKEAKRGLQEAKKLLMLSKKQEFCDTLSKTFQQYLSGKLRLPVGTITFDMVNEKLKIDADTKDDIKNIFEQCDLVRFASFEISAKDMQESFNRLEKIIDYLERHLK